MYATPDMYIHAKERTSLFTLNNHSKAEPMQILQPKPHVVYRIPSKLPYSMQANPSHQS